MPRSSSRRSFVVQLMSNAAGVWVGVSTGGFLAWLSGCGSSRSTTSNATGAPPVTVAAPIEPDPSSPAPVNTMATAPEGPDDVDAGCDTYEPPDESPGPVVKYGGPPTIAEPPSEIRPMYGGPVMTATPRKYGGPPSGGYD